MKNSISFTNLTKKRIKTADFKNISKKILPGWELSVVFADSGLMRKLNKKYRKKDKLTDVLSFKFGKNNGEVFLNAEEKKLLHLFMHACLHLLGYDHGTKKETERMEKKEKEVLSNF